MLCRTWILVQAVKQKKLQTSQLQAITCSKLTVETLAGVKYV